MNLKQQVEKTQKSTEAVCLKILSWLNFFKSVYANKIGYVNIQLNIESCTII